MKSRKTGKLFVCLTLLALVLGLGGMPAARAESNLVVGNNATVHLDFQITIPQILFLQVGTLGATQNVVSCTLSDIPGTGAVAMTSNGANPVPVRAAALVAASAPVRLLANSATPLSNGAATIPFTQISWTGAADFSSGTFSGAAGQVLDAFAGSGDRNGTYTFTYANANYYDVGTYTGEVTYTLASP
jgi:hypothetical protein